MEKAFKYRIYPNKNQRILIAKTFGCCRFVYNTYLAKRIELYESSKEAYSYVQCANDMKKLKSEKKMAKRSGFHCSPIFTQRFRFGISEVL